MKILFVADGRSPIASNWIRYFVEQGYEVHLVSLFPCQPSFLPASLTILPLRFSSAVGERQSAPGMRTRILRRLAPSRFRTWLRQRFVPASIPQAAATLAALIARIQPQVVHGMRIPYEGMVAAAALAGNDLPVALLVSVWGNDFTLHAPATRTLSRLTKQTLQAVDGLHTDCFRDQTLASAWGFDPQKQLAVVLPGAGGIQLDVFYPPAQEPRPVVINPRGIRAYVRSDTFFRSIPLVLEKHPQARFICPNMKGQPEAEKWITRLGIGNQVALLPYQTREAMAGLYRQARVVVSPSLHDGTPNTLLEAMACGCFPVAGDIETLREWITPGLNGLLVDPADSKWMAEGICLGLESASLREQAKERNLRLIQDRAEYNRVMGKAEEFYRQLAERKPA
jgi:glycosyltransferase involved in cell wall biosynthesis